MLVVEDEIVGILLRQSADGGRRMQQLEHISHTLIVLEGEGEVATQMHQVGRTHGARSLLMDIVGHTLQTVHQIGGHIALLLDILRAPRHVFALAQQVVALQFHGAGQRNGAPLVADALQQDLGRCREPHATLGRTDQRDKHTGIHLASPLEEGQRLGILFGLYLRTPAEHQLTETSVGQSGKEAAEVIGVSITIKTRRFPTGERSPHGQREVAAH